MTAQYHLKINHLNELLNKRFASYPVRDDSYFRLMEALDDFAVYLRQKIDFNAFHPEIDIVRATEAFSDKPVFICGSMKSGTTLLAQLLDNHPDLIVMPGDSHYAHQIDKWKRSQFAELSSHWLGRLINPTGKEPFWFIGPDEKPLEQFLLYLHYYLNDPQREVFLCIVMSIYAAVSAGSGLTEKKYWVEKTPHNELNLDLLTSHFPRARFIHILRDPLENIVSLKRISDIRKWNTTTFEFAVSIKNLFRAAKTNQNIVGTRNYHIIKYEDLVARPRNTLYGICDFLDISFHDSLLQPTENGVQALSNSMFRESRIRGKILDQSKTKRYIENLSKEEIQTIVKVLYPEAIRVGYDWDSPEIASYRCSKLRLYFCHLTILLKQKLAKILTQHPK